MKKEKESNIKVELLHSTPLWVASRAIRKCWASEGKSDTSFDEYFENPITGDIHTHVETGQKDKELIDRSIQTEFSPEEIVALYEEKDLAEVAWLFWNDIKCPVDDVLLLLARLACCDEISDKEFDCLE